MTPQLTVEVSARCWPPSPDPDGPVRRYAELFRAARAADPSAGVADFLPAADDPLYLPVLFRLACLEMELDGRPGRRADLEAYRRRFPGALADPAHFREFEQFVARRRVPRPPPDLRPDAPDAPGQAPLPPTVEVGGGEGPSAGGGADCSLPGFEVLEVIGQGAFARVYLARQHELGGRLVVLKVSREKVGEAEVLAQLLHTNIVPIYSVHEVGGAHATCMPYLGRTTLAEILEAVRLSGLPGSGRHLVQTLQCQSSTRKSMRSRDSARCTPPSLPPLADAPGGGEFPAKVGTRLILDNLESLTYVNAVLWLTSQLADGLRHAHERGILHRDLKPANILLTDEGQPMLLDFNLAEDTKLRNTPEAAKLGGTLVYMSPEQMKAFDGHPHLLDARSDIFSLGVIVYELLTGRFPYPARAGRPREILGRLIRDRQAAPPRLRCHNAEVTPGVESIVRKCLEADPARRYRSARELQEDIRRHLENLPLKYAPERSWLERARKWRRRHPRMASLTTVTALAAAMILTLVVSLHVRGERLARLEALDAFRAFEGAAVDAQLVGAAGAADLDDLGALFDCGRAALGSYGVLTDPDWRKRRDVRYLPAGQQARLDRDVAALLLVLAQGKVTLASYCRDTAERERLVREALELNGCAEKTDAAAHFPKTLWAQRATMVAMLGDDGSAGALKQKSAEAAGSADAYLVAREHLARGEARQALPHLEGLLREEPRNIPAWFLKGRCLEEAGQDGEAVTCYTVCIGLRPEGAAPYFRRGLAHLRRQQYEPARLDFTTFLQLEEDNPDALFNRALAWHGLGHTDRALADLDAAMKLDAPYTRIYFLRARYREQVGDAAGAGRDREQGLKRTPRDEKSWIARGVARAADDPRGALEDFRQALAVNPASLAALLNSARVLARQGRHDDAVGMLDRLLEIYPSYVDARLTRGLLHAQAGRREEALRDARECLGRSNDAATQFRAGGVYAVTSKAEPRDRAEAIRLLRSALLQGHGFDRVGSDPNLQLLRETPEFRQLLAGVAALKGA